MTEKKMLRTIVFDCAPILGRRLVDDWEASPSKSVRDGVPDHA